MNEGYQEEMRRRLLLLATETEEAAGAKTSVGEFTAVGASLAAIAAAIFAVRKYQSAKTNDQFERL